MSIEDLPDELLVKIFEHVPGVHKMHNISKRFSDIITDIKQRVHENPNKYIENLSDPVSFLLYDSNYHKAIWDKAIIKGDLYLITELYRLDYKFNDDVSMRNAVEQGHKNLVEFFIKLGYKDWKIGLEYAALGGHKDLIEFFIKKGATDWDLGMIFAARGGHMNLVKFFINEGAIVFNSAMISAARGGHKDLVDFFIEKGANKWYEAMHGAEHGGHEDLVDFFEAKLQINN